ncbi:hypothetical protein OQ279_08080 [Salinimicrobium sp. MT39]|uniref:Lipoprotein n=1 Tax=Salinimicrobium profundisediminis TaxID=2994553 RepID=A0A9X3CWJ3_9FLAO|nr:hypothetical protein [Salinimicrobium profundisediminis]MCX2838111.1 hypothetical protein [Salinimicrobium profundisediminis]
MKKIFYLFFLPMIFLSCSSDNDEVNSNGINPPDWIQGTWLAEGSITGDVGFRFTGSDVVLLQNLLDTSYGDLVNHSRELGQKVEIEQDVSSDYYSLHLIFSSGQTMKFEFRKISNDEIAWVQSQNTILVKQ